MPWDQVKIAQDQGGSSSPSTSRWCSRRRRRTAAGTRIRHPQARRTPAVPERRRN